MQGKDRTVHRRAAGTGPRVRRATVPGRFGKAWASRGTANLLIWAPCNRFASMDAYPARLKETQLAFIRRVDGSESAGAGPGADHVRVGMQAEGAKRRLGVGRRGVCAWR